MYPENKNPRRRRNIVISVIIALIYCGLLAYGIVTVMQLVGLYQDGTLQAWLEENTDGYDDGASEFGYYDENGDFQYYGRAEEEEPAYGYYGEDGEFHYYDDEDDRSGIFDYDTHEDNEGYANGEYFSMPADNRVDGLAYTVALEEKEYFDEDVPNTYISYSYAVVEGDVPNAASINETISSEWESLLDFYENQYKPGMYSRDDYIMAQLQCNVAYMSEDILSLAYQETLYYGAGGGNASEFYLYSLNFDMQNGQPLGNTGILDINEAFVEEFRERSNEQNGDSVLDYYSDSDLIQLFEDENSLILFYCPQGMEIGVNMNEGWVKVTYADYEEYLRKI